MLKNSTENVFSNDITKFWAVAFGQVLKLKNIYFLSFPAVKNNKCLSYFRPDWYDSCEGNYYTTTKVMNKWWEQMSTNHEICSEMNTGNGKNIYYTSLEGVGFRNLLNSLYLYYVSQMSGMMAI